MRILTLISLSAGLASVGACASPRAAAADDGAGWLAGNWKLVAVQAVEDELFLIRFGGGEGAISAEIADAPGPASQRPKLGEIKVEGGLPRLGFGLFGGDASFVGATKGDGKVYGTLRFLDQILPARLEKTDAEALGPRLPAERERAMIAAMKRLDPKERVRGIADEVDRGNPRDDQGAYAVLIGSAADAGLPEEDVRRHLDAWASGAKPYGDAWADHVDASILKTLTGKRPYARLALERATRRWEGLGEAASLPDRADVARARVIAAELAGEAELAAATRAESRRLEEALDAAYLKEMPPFKPKGIAPRADAQSDRVVLLELFTGAHSAPGAANEVALDALAGSHGPGELIALQYHLRIPPPDPLACPDGQERKLYYGIRMIPSTFFNGRPGAPGGGPMSHAERKYDEYRRAIDESLDGRKRAEIDLKVARVGDAIEIDAAARIAPDSGGKDGGKPRLRLALVEQRVRYAGENRVRFHRNIVRALPGGAEGKELAEGQCRAEATVNLGQLREELREDFAKSFDPGREPTPPEGEIETGGLAVVAFVQDDETKEVFHAVLAPIGAEE